MSFRQITTEWIKGDYRTFANLNVDSNFFAARFGIEFEQYIEEGLGQAKSAGLLTTEGTQFYLTEYLPNSKHFIMEIGLLNNEKTLFKDLDEVLEVLELNSSNLTWFDEKIELQPHELWRQDDNGHQFLIETFTCKADAVKAMKEFEARLHKQIYWIEKAKI